MALEEGQEPDYTQDLPTIVEIGDIMHGSVAVDKRVAWILISPTSVSTIADKALLMKFWAGLKNSGMQYKYPPISRLATMVCDGGHDPVESFSALEFLMERPECRCTPEDLCENFPDPE